MINRIIGILVVVAIGVLLSPLFLDRHEISVQAQALRTPPFPDEQAQNGTIRALKGYDNMVKSAMKKSLSISLKNTVWVIQVGTYKDKVSALRLVNQLRAQGYNAFIYQEGAAFRETTQVYIGPEPKRDSAELLASKLAKEAHLYGIVKSYKPFTT